MQEIGKGSGVVIAHEGQRLIIIDRKTTSIFTVVFVLGLLASIPGLSGILMLSQSMLTLGLSLLGVGLIFGAGFALALRAKRQREQIPLAEMTPLLVLDLEAGQLLDGAGRQLAPLEQTRFSKRFQFGSSSPALVATYPGGEIVVARGNGLMGGLGSLPGVLARRGLMG